MISKFSISGRRNRERSDLSPNNRIRILFLTMIVLSMLWNNALLATTFTCQAPGAGGIFTISLKSFTDRCGPIQVNIPAGSTAAQKASLIAAKINTACPDVFAASSSGADVTVTNTLHPGQRIFFKFGPDATGEKDKIEDDLQPGWWDSLWGETAPLFVCSSPASGTSFDGVNPGKIYIGTSTLVQVFQLSPGSHRKAS